MQALHAFERDIIKGVLMRICYFGTFNKDYLRNRIIREGFRRNGVEVVLCHTKYTWFLMVYLKLTFRWVFKTRKNIDAIIVGETGYILMPLAKLIGLIWGIPVILDAFFSVYQTEVYDRKRVSKNSLKAQKIHFIEEMGCKLADLVLLDTNEHIGYFVDEHGIDRKKFLRVLVGADDSIFKPLELKAASDKFRVLYWGTFIPLHGVEYIIGAAKILESENEIVFKFIGNGQTRDDAVRLSEELGLKNTEFVDYTDEASLVKSISEASVCMGIFGNTLKTKEVIPHKLYQAMACKKPVITGDTPATRELLKDMETVMFCETGNPGRLAEKIMFLKNNRETAGKIAAEAYRYFKGNLVPEQIVKGLINRMETGKNG
ncbi:MAG: hypothetical protein A2297_01095 [Elusimicrobia bacterium RIFOXYB2_FULL_48_7]|nr:MAG: hypothetical protein A2297_01095 [Elusimicrobia bacterium RIFOXYB2_FULL_48_7]